MIKTDVLIIGSGIAGVATALRLASDRKRKITLVTRAKDTWDSNSNLAQGGIVARGETDSKELLVTDVLKAGVGLSEPQAVELLAEEGPKLVHNLLIDKLGIAFDRSKTGKLKYGLEAVHSKRRILHVGDTTGRAIMAAMLDEAVRQPNIKFLVNHTAVDLITFPHHSKKPISVYEPPTCHGAYALRSATGKVVAILAGKTVLATGGLGQIFLNTSNPVGARGDGLAMAYRAGARVANSEYIQFHPTTLYMPGATKFLISEAVRGEGGVLKTPKGKSFMHKYSAKWKDLAARDVVARAIYWEMIANDYPYVLLDIASQRQASYIRKRFPQIYETCLQHNIDITSQAIPVTPAAHYFCGGVLVDLWGRSSIEGLYAVGEVSCTGVHGANRLASTSLLEGLVWGDRAGRDIKRRKRVGVISKKEVPEWDDSGLKYNADPALIQGDMQTIRNLMWHYVGLVRSAHRLDRAVRELSHLRQEIEEFYRKTKLTDALVGLRNSVQVALLIARAARTNRESRGSHYREDN